MKNRGWIGIVLMLGVGAGGCGSGDNDSASEAPVPDLAADAGSGSPQQQGELGAEPGGSAGAGAAPTGANPAIPPAQAPTAGPGTAAGSPIGVAGTGASAGAAAPAVPPQSWDAGQDDRFEAVGSNPFVLAAHDPFSTFAADVDTASYDIFRQQAERKLLPIADSVRVEDFVNYFSYAYPAPAADAEHPFAVSLAAAPNAFGRDTTLLRVGIQAENPPPFQKKPTNLVFLVDTSGSMSAPEKLPLVQYLIKHGLDVLAAEDRVSIVTYSSQALIQLPPTAVSAKAEIAAVVDRLYAEGSTNGAGGIQLAYEQATMGFIAGGINHVVLCTDGDFNIGISDPKLLVDFIKDKRASGVTLTALGFGNDNLNDVLMEKVSNAGNGMYSVITSEGQAARYAEDRMLRTLMHVAKDLKIQIEFNPEQVEAYRLIGYENRAIADSDFRDDQVDAGEVGAGHRVTALYELVRKGETIPAPERAPAAKGGNPVAGEREAGAEDLVLVKVRYKEPNATDADAAKEVVSRLAPSEIGGLFDQADQDLRWVAAMAAFAEILKESPYATPSQLGALREVFASQAERDTERKEFLTLFDATVAVLPAP